MEPQGKVNCEVCCCSKSAREFIRFADCGHTFCVSCAKISFELNISESRTDIQCLSCSEPVSPHDIAIVVDQHFFAKYLEFSLRRYLSVEANVRRCVAPDCSFAYILEDPSDCTDDHFVCGREECKANFCYKCKLPWHDGRECDEQCSVTLDMYSAAKNIKACPRCGSMIEKVEDGSCNHVKCSLCGREFCWLCLREVSEMHFMSPTGCTLYGNRQWSAKRKWCCRMCLWLTAPLFIPLLALVLFSVLPAIFPIFIGYMIRDTYKCGALCCVLFLAVTLLYPVTSLLISLLLVPLGFLYIYGFVPVHLLWTYVHRTHGQTSGSRQSLISDALFVTTYGATD